VKKNLIVLGLIALGFVTNATAQSGSVPNLTLLAHWDDDTLPVASPDGLNVQYSGCWGMAVNNREYAILGAANSVLVFDVTNPAQPQLTNKFFGETVTIWREFKSYRNRLYAVSDGTQEGLMVIDFSNAPAQITRTYFSDTLFKRSHSITLDTISGHIYLNGGSSGSGIIILDASQNPDSPTVLVQIPSLPGGYIHDSYVRNDTLYASSGYNGYYIYDFKTDPQNPTVIANISTGGYNHNSWLTTDGRYAYYTEEIPKARPVQIVDLQNLTDPIPEIDLVGPGFLDALTPNSTNEPIPHNVYIKDTILFNSQYEDGLLLYSISDPTQPRLIGRYDTHTQNTIYNGYFGNWGNYPWLPSGTIIAGDMQNGLYLLKYSPISSETPVLVEENWFSVQPNPARDRVTMNLSDLAAWGGEWSYRIHAANHPVVREVAKLRDRATQIDVSDLPGGVYFVEIRGANGRSQFAKMVVAH
jgi:choice-of-anchor B domain-containing protein